MTPIIKRDGGSMPVLGLGTFQMENGACTDAVTTALDAGYRHLDTARMYGNEEAVGAGIRDAGVAREELFLTTKIPPDDLEPERLRRECDASLSELKTDYVDLLLIHWPNPSVPIAETLGVMTTLKQEGKIRHLGISNFTVPLIHEAVEACDEALFCNQVEYHPLLDQAPVLQACRQHGLILVAYSPLAQGKVVEHETLAAIGKKHGKTAAQVSLRWLIEQEGVAAIPKGSGQDHIRQNLDIFGFELDDEDRAAIEDLRKNERIIDPDKAPDWDT